MRRDGSTCPLSHGESANFRWLYVINQMIGIIGFSTGEASLELGCIGMPDVSASLSNQRIRFALQFAMGMVFINFHLKIIDDNCI